ncbi:MAG: bacterial transcriptional activator domain-containing protein [Proteobacteria bacterium]|nr:bacterial transcriptional activator domain-containing protein [Pseudomonadota bacterium]
MTPAPIEVPTAGEPRLSEQALAAASPGLLAQPALWSSLRLAPGDQTMAASAPWTAYWATRMDAALDPVVARTRLAAARDTMAQRGDRTGELACLAAIIEGYYVDEGALDSLDGWIAALVDRLPSDDDWPSPDFEAHVMACGIGVLLRAPQHPLLARWAERGAVLVRRIKPGAGRLKLATFLAQYHFWRGEFDRTALIVDALPGLDVAGLLPAEVLVWLETVANHARCAGQPARGRAAIDHALRLLRQHGLQHHVYALHAHGASLALADGDADGAQVHVDAMRPVLDNRPQADQTHYWHFQAGLALARGDALRAVELARAAMGNAGEIGGPFRSAMQALSLGQALLCAGDAAAALPAIEQAMAAARSIDASLVLYSATLMHAACLLHLGHDEAASRALRDGWTLGARRDYATTASWWLPDVIGELAREALARGIEPAYVRRFVRRHALPGPDPALADWPWPLVLRAFGSFEALRDDRPLVRSSGKTAHRPLDLLRALLAHGGRLPVATALQWLWPEADAAAQRKAFDVALLRLRRMLDDPRLLQLEGGRLSLGARWVWTDVGALQALMQAIGAARDAPLEQLQRWAGLLLDLMRGPFLAGDEADWVRAARERHRRRFVVAVDQLAAQIEPLDAPAAQRLYERALDVEPLAESLSRRLMRLHAGCGDHAEALRVWRACRAMLQVAEGLEPSRETRALAAALGLGEAH